MMICKYGGRVIVCTFTVLVVCLELLVHSENNKLNVELTRLGNITYTSKTLGGHFYKHNGKLYLIGGTEVRDGSYAQIFVYSLEDNALILNKTIRPSICILSFCEIGEKIFFATISRNEKDGCDLYSFDIENKSIQKMMHFSEKGIYAMSWDGNDSIYIATSRKPRLYRYSLRKNESEMMLEGFTNETFIRSMQYKDGKCYLGIGSNADLIDVDVKSKEWHSILPKELKNNTFIYNINIFDNYIYTLLKNDMGIYSSPLDEINFERVTDYRMNTQKKHTKGVTDRWIDIEGNILFLGENGEVYEQYALDGLRSFFEEDTMWSLDSSCIVHKYYDGQEYESIDLGEVLKKSYIIPMEFIAYDDVLYFPGRRFTVWNRNDNTNKVFIVKDEPQASTLKNEFLYTGNYPQCTMYRYPLDTFKIDGNRMRMNDKEFFLAKIDNQCRPAQMDVTLNGDYLVMGSGPLYGKFGGKISVFDIEMEKLLYSADVVEKQAIRTVKKSEKYQNAVWLGTTPYGENTNPPYLCLPAHVVLWDVVQQEALLDFTIKDDVRKIICIEEIDDLVYVTTEEGFVYSYGVESGRVKYCNSKDGILYLLKLKDGRLLGRNSRSIYLIDRKTLKATVLADGFSRLSNLIQDPVTGKIYCFDKTELVEMKID